MEDRNSIDNFFAMVERVKKLTVIFNKLNEHNSRLQSQIVELEQKLSGDSGTLRNMELEEEVKRLKSENKTLKEREKTIRTKIERLEVKLEQLH
jgi:predicted  nucleic acid-binding Zn-ribbon protein